MCLDTCGVRSNQFGSSNVPPIDAKCFWKSLKIEKSFVPQVAQKLNGDPLFRFLRGLSISRRLSGDDRKNAVF